MKTTIETPNLANAINDLCQAAESLGGKPVFDHQKPELLGPLREGFAQVFDGINEVLGLPFVVEETRANNNVRGWVVSQPQLSNLQPNKIRPLAELVPGNTFLYVDLAPSTKSRMVIGWQ